MSAMFGVEAALEGIREAAKKSPPAPEEMFERRRCRCYRCKRAMASSEPVWRLHISELKKSMFSVWGMRQSSSIQHFCHQCVGDVHAHSQGECTFCKREIHDCAHRGWRCPRYYYCCDDCRVRGESARQSAAVRAKRAEARGPSRECVQCGEVFETVRAHARFCSGKCRQSAYRRRGSVTDMKLRAERRISET
jgi:hypothetical protein